MSQSPDSEFVLNCSPTSPDEVLCPATPSPPRTPQKANQIFTDWVAEERNLKRTIRQQRLLLSMSLAKHQVIVDDIDNLQHGILAKQARIANHQASPDPANELAASRQAETAMVAHQLKLNDHLIERKNAAYPAGGPVEENGSSELPVLVIKDKEDDDEIEEDSDEEHFKVPPLKRRKLE